MALELVDKNDKYPSPSQSFEHLYLLYSVNSEILFRKIFSTFEQLANNLNIKLSSNNPNFFRSFSKNANDQFKMPISLYDIWLYMISYTIDKTSISWKYELPSSQNNLWQFSNLLYCMSWNYKNDLILPINSDHKFLEHHLQKKHNSNFQKVSVNYLHKPDLYYQKLSDHPILIDSDAALKLLIKKFITESFDNFYFNRLILQKLYFARFDRSYLLCAY